MEESNWINQLTMGIVGIQHILEDVKKYSTKNDSVKQSYDEAIDKVKMQERPFIDLLQYIIKHNN